MRTSTTGQLTRREPRPPLIAPADVATHPEAERVWRGVCERLAQIGLGPEVMANWIEPASAIGIRQGALSIEAPQVTADWIRRRFGSLIGELVRDEGTFTGLRIYDARPPADRDRAL